MLTALHCTLDGKPLIPPRVWWCQTVREVGEDRGWAVFEPADTYVKYEKAGQICWRMNAEVLCTVDAQGIARITVTGGQPVPAGEAEAVCQRDLQQSGMTWFGDPPHARENP